MSSLKSILVSQIGKAGEEAAAKQAVEKLVMKSQLVWANEIGQMKLAVYDAQNAITTAQGDPNVSVGEFLRLQRVLAALTADVTAAEAAQTARFGA